MVVKEFGPCIKDRFTKPDKTCGSESGYVMGCRAESCRVARRKYQNKRTVKKGSYISAENARAHIEWLLSLGAVQNRIQEVADLSSATLWWIKNDPKHKVRIDIEERILALNKFSPIFHVKDMKVRNWWTKRKPNGQFAKKEN